MLHVERGFWGKMMHGNVLKQVKEPFYAATASVYAVLLGFWMDIHTHSRGEKQ